MKDINQDTFLLKLLHFSQFSFIVFPLLSLIAPIIVWLSQREKDSRVNRAGKRIIQFQLFWNILFWTIAIFLAWMRVIHLNTAPSLSFFITVILLLYLFNAAMIIKQYLSLR